MTELVDFAPDEIAIAPDLLGHADLETTRKHYIKAQGMTRAPACPGADRDPTACGGIA